MAQPVSRLDRAQKCLVNKTLAAPILAYAVSEVWSNYHLEGKDIKVEFRYDNSVDGSALITIDLIHYW